MNLIKGLLDIQIQKTGVSFNRFLSSTSALNDYARMLENTYAYVKLSVPTMRAVANSTLGSDISLRLNHAADQEEGHEIEILNNLRSIGFDVGQQKLSPYVNVFCSREMNILLEDNPLEALLGHMIVLEGHHPSDQQVEKLVRNFELKKESASCFFTHATADETHTAELNELLEMKCINKDRALMSAIYTAQLFESHWDWMTSEIAHE
jgi:hypothetical protein